ncbi:MAG: GMC family oxidoreductase N-terminal domain-containing protein [Pseudomonadota bacterium]
MTAQDCDVLIIGAGTAGCVLASRLSERADYKIHLVEAGGEPTDPRISNPAAWPLLGGSAIDWKFETVPQRGTAGRVHEWPRGKVIGGSSALHAMGHMRGHPADFDGWEAAGATGWNFETLLPYFVRSETSPFAGEEGYGASGPVHLEQPSTPHPLTQAHRKACANLGFMPIRDHNGKEMAGPTLNTLTIADGKRVSAADAYLPPTVRARGNLHVGTGLLVDRLIFDDENRAIGILAHRDGKPIELRARVGVVLTAGAIGTPTILMRSGIGPAQPLSALSIPVLRDSPAVGENLQDHLLAAGNVYLASQKVPPTTTQHSESLCYIHAKGQGKNDAPALVVGIVTVPVITDTLRTKVNAPDVGDGYTLMFGITHPASRGRLSITSPDPRSTPSIDPAYLTARIDRTRFVEALTIARSIGASEAYSPWRKEELLPTPEDLIDDASIELFIERAAYTHHHPVGTCRMGSDDHAPVTPDLAVRGTSGLYVVDGSIIPSLTTGPVNAAILAIAERAADLLPQQF